MLLFPEILSQEVVVDRTSTYLERSPTLFVMLQTFLVLSSATGSN
jgi:hypothetical protein